ncbi:hypothetical protein CVT26_008571 [Gymnopilus dilepis]|uniref:DNA 3'-5' helicase n=1 Tax=Gymnopilus dilepis TaxID=231916 RepID=A0A409XXT3_9AGAR|nr:hypothetical protein CVT26_008571 [Gymnopilus dilepis]
MLPAHPNEISDGFSWLSVRGRTIIREIIEGRLPQWPKGPHESQVDCWAHCLQRIPTLLIASTGWGKTAAFFGPILVLQHLLSNPKPGIPKLPSKPVALIVTPLVELGKAHAREIGDIGLGSVAVCAETLTRFSQDGRDLFREIRQCQWPIVLLSPERLTSKEVDVVLRDEYFRSNLILFGIDEAHVLVPWGKEFRKAYHQISSLLKRLPSHTTLVAVTATLSAGNDYVSLCNELNLKPGRFNCIRLPSERPNLRTIYRDLTHTLSGYHFPDIEWVFKRGVKCILYCQTIDLGFRVAMYGWSLYPDGASRLQNVRLWSSITSDLYNSKTLELFRDREDTTVIVATIAFGMGMNLRNVIQSINLGLPSSFPALVQQNGRAGRDLALAASGITYIEPSIMAAVDDVLETNKTRKKAAATLAKSQKRIDDLDPPLKDSLFAHRRRSCLVVVHNVALGNSGPKSRLTCVEAGRPNPCSSCEGLINATQPASTPMPPSNTLSTSPQPTDPRARKPRILTAPLPPPLTKNFQDNARVWLGDFAVRRWLLKDDNRARTLPQSAIWQGISIDHVISQLHLLRSRESLDIYLANWDFIDTDGDALFALVDTLNKTFDKHSASAKAIKVKKAAATRTKNKGDDSFCHASVCSNIGFLQR